MGGCRLGSSNDGAFAGVTCERRYCYLVLLEADELIMLLERGSLKASGYRLISYMLSFLVLCPKPGLGHPFLQSPTSLRHRWLASDRSLHCETSPILLQRAVARSDDRRSAKNRPKKQQLIPSRSEPARRCNCQGAGTVSWRSLAGTGLDSSDADGSVLGFSNSLQLRLDKIFTQAKFDDQWEFPVQ